MEKASKLNPTDIKFYYVKPTLSIPNIIIILIIIFIFAIIMLRWNHIKINWETEKCNNSNFLFAPFFQQDSTTTLQKCTADIVDKSVKDSLSNLNLKSEMDDLNKKFTDLSNNIAKIQSNSADAVSNTINNGATILNKVKSNIDTLKTSLQNVLGTVIISSYLNNGVIQSTASLNNSDLVNMSKMEEIKTAYNKEAASVNIPQIS